MRNRDSALTPVKDLFVYHIFGMPAELSVWQKDPAGYSLIVDGLVKNPLRLTLDDLREKHDACEREMVLECMTCIHAGRVLVRGARLWHLLKTADPLPGALKAAFKSADGFDTDLTIDEIREHPDDFLVAYEMNSAPLTRSHGFPVRLAAYEKYGYKWPKWLTRITLVDHDYKGHYEGRRGWSDDAVRGRPVI
jgi:DMSO/TMAO reductase YedYZ molybdopterin-dependent catalytic subunit